MIESGVLNIDPGSSNGGRSTSGHGVGASALTVAMRGALEAIGLICVLAGMLIAAVPAWREPLVETIGSALSVPAIAAEDDASGRPFVANAQLPRLGQQVLLTESQNNVAMYLSRRYHVADEAVRVMVAAAQVAGKDRQIDPLLILAVVAVESSMNPFAQSPVGAKGLMQVMPEVHRAKFLDRAASLSPLDPVANIQVGSEILGDVIRRGGSVERGLALYVGAGNLADDGGYANRVLGEFSRLKMAASGEIAAALAAGLHSDSRVEGPGPLSSSASSSPGHKRPA
jgi:soluble lytic murein transglycosylase-like protein